MALLLSFSLVACNIDRSTEDQNSQGIENKDDMLPVEEEENNEEKEFTEEEISEVIESVMSLVLKEDGYYTSKDDVSLYIYTYDKLPNNYITKKEATDKGWEASEGNLWEVTDKKSIGGDKFGNREKLLPSEDGREYYECDINYEGGPRGAERLVYSNDGLIYYTGDHYESFTLLYGDE